MNRGSRDDIETNLNNGGSPATVETGEKPEITDEYTTKYVKGSLALPKPYKVFGLEIMAFSHPRVQACMLGCVLFLTVGMYNVITFLGGAGQKDAYLSDIANISLYTVFTVFCFVAPGFLNFFGLRACLCFGGFGYAAYAASLWCYNHTRNTGFVIFGGAWCGLSAAFLWVAEGTAITAFASEDKKGLYVSIFWSIFQVGVVIGSAIPVGQNWNTGTDNNSTVNDGTYVGLFILMIIGSFFGLIIYPWEKMVREDGSRVRLEYKRTLVEELVHSWVVFRTHIWILMFWPFCWAINYYLVYQNNMYNSLVFSVRGRALNTLLSGIVQIPAAWILSLFNDHLPFKRRVRALCGAAYVFFMFNAVWIGGYFAMRETKYGLDESEKYDVFDSGYGVRCFLFVMYGYMDATYNCYAFWFMGALSNETDELSVYVSMFRMLNAACQICAYSLDLRGYSKEFLFGTSWAFIAAGPVCLLPIIKYYMKDTNMIEAPTEGVVVAQVEDVTMEKKE